MAKKKSPPLPLYRNIAVSFSALTLLLIVTIFYFSIARATITVVPNVQPLPFTATVAIAKEPASGASSLPGSVFAEEATVQDTFPAFVVREEDGKATGKVHIVNTSGNAQALIATTRFLTPEKILFRLKETVTVPAKGSVDATLVADIAGAAGEVAPTRFTIPGLNAQLQEKIYGESKVPMAGGRRTVHRLTQKDIDDARAVLLQKMQDTARSKVTEQGAFTDPLILFSVEPTATALQQKLGAEVATFSLSLSARVRGVVLSEKVLHEWVSAQMKTLLPDDQRLLTLPSDAVSVSVTALDVSAGTARLLVKANGASVIRSASALLDRSRFVGRTPNEVEALFRNEPSVASVRVMLTPFFIKRLPRLPDHIRVEINEL